MFKYVVFGLALALVSIAGCAEMNTSGASGDPSSSISLDQAATEPEVNHEEDLAYLDMVQGQSVSFVSILADYAELLEDKECSDEEWLSGIEASHVLLRELRDEALACVPPASLSHIHAKYIQGLDHIQQMTVLMDAAIYDDDLDALHQALEEVKLGAACIRETSSMIREYEASISNGEQDGR